jgi:hypothetical protein
MGCDIHSYAEKKVNGKWEMIKKAFPNPYYQEGKENKIDEDGYEWNPQFTDQPYKGRNYDLFGILADVRNGRGFAGIKTGEGFSPIAEPKGLPEDVSPEIKKESDGWNGDGHSHSYFTLKELQDYDWMQTTKSYGTVTLEEYKKFKETKIPPDYYCGGVSGGSVINLTNKEMDKAIAENSFIKGYEYYTRIGWETTYKDAVGKYFFETTMENLKKIAPPEDVRIVFWFDN